MAVYRIQLKDRIGTHSPGIRIEYILKANSMIEAIESVINKEHKDFNHVISVEMAELLPDVIII